MLAHISVFLRKTHWGGEAHSDSKLTLVYFISSRTTIYFVLTRGCKKKRCHPQIIKTIHRYPEKGIWMTVVSTNTGVTSKAVSKTCPTGLWP